MPGIVDRLRSGAGRAAFEADKLRRISAIQAAIKPLKEEVNQAFYRAGHIASELYRTGLITPPALREACEQIATLQARLVAYEREIEAIRNEVYVEAQPYGSGYLLCPNGHGSLPPGTQFCAVCGSQATYMPPPPMGSPCQGCGTALVPGARFCPACGMAVTDQATTSLASESPNICPACGTSLLPEATFCGNCGQRMSGNTDVV